jgi:ABC-2 type transport system permease protein
MIQVGSGAGHLQSVIAQEISAFTHTRTDVPVNLVLRSQYNPNRESVWFVALMQVVNNITLLAIFLTGAALIREREHGTIEHLLVMPLTPAEIMLAKIWANGLVVVVAASLSLKLMVQGVLGVPIAGSLPLFVAGEVVYLFSVTALGIFLATLARSMPQFALLAMPVFIVMNLLSGSNTPFEACRLRCRTSCGFRLRRISSACRRPSCSAGPGSMWYGRSSWRRRGWAWCFSSAPCCASARPSARCMPD